MFTNEKAFYSDQSYQKKKKQFTGDRMKEVVLYHHF